MIIKFFIVWYIHSKMCEHKILKKKVVFVFDRSNTNKLSQKKKQTQTDFVNI